MCKTRRSDALIGCWIAMHFAEKSPSYLYVVATEQKIRRSAIDTDLKENHPTDNP